MISVIDELTTYIRRHEIRNYGRHVPIRKKTRRESDLSVNRDNYHSNIRNRNTLRNCSPSTSDTSAYIEYDTTEMISMMDDIICVSAEETRASESLWNMPGCARIGRDTNSPPISDSCDFNEKRAGLPIDVDSLNKPYRAGVMTEQALFPIASPLELKSKFDDLSNNVNAKPPEFSRMSNYVPLGKVDECLQTGESMTFSDATFSSHRLNDDILFQFEDTINAAAFTDQLTLVHCGTSNECSDSFIFDNSDKYPTMTRNRDFVCTDQTMNRKTATESIHVASNENEDMRCNVYSGQSDTENAPLGLHLFDVNVNCSVGSSTFEGFVPISSRNVAFDVKQSLMYDERTFGSNVTLRCEYTVADPSSHVLDTDHLNTSIECTETSNGCMNKCELTRQDISPNEVALEMFQINMPHFSSQFETVKNGFASLDEQPRPVNIYESLSELGGAIANDDMYLSNDRSCCGFNLKSNTIRDVLHNTGSISGTAEDMRDDRCIVESWDTSIDHTCDPNQMPDFYCPFGEYHELSPPQTPNNLCTSNDCLQSPGCDIMFGGTHDFGSMTNLSDLEGVSSSSMLGSLSYVDTITAHDPRICETSDSQDTQKRLNCALDHNDTPTDFRSDCSYGERYYDHIPSTSRTQTPACYEVTRTCPAPCDDCDISAKVVSAVLPHHTYRMPHDVCGADGDVEKYDDVADKHVNEALDLLLSIMGEN